MSVDVRTCVYFNHGTGPQCELHDLHDHNNCDGICKDYQPNLEYIAEKRKEEQERMNSDEGCFLTSACVDALGMEDDCYELTMLRNFRDGWLTAQDSGKSDISRYYELAPQVVESINKLANSKEIYSDIYKKLVKPCVKMIEEKRMNDTWNHYKEYSERLFSKYAKERG